MTVTRARIVGTHEEVVTLVNGKLFLGDIRIFTLGLEGVPAPLRCVYGSRKERVFSYAGGNCTAG